MSNRFWFVPAVLALAAVLLFFLTQYLDQVVKTEIAGLPVVFSGGATAARSVLSTIAGSLITVVATVFSITVVTLQLAASNYSPRLLRNFTSDRGVQAVLGAYIATFLYSLLVLRIIRTPESEGAEFNPVVSVTVAVLLALLCVALLIYFIAHVVNLIQSSTIVKRAHADTAESLARLEDLEEAAEETPEDILERPDLVGLLKTDPLVVRADASGYVQYLDVNALVDAVLGGEETDGPTVVEVPFAPGDFVAAGLTVVRAWPGPRLDGGRTDDARSALRSALYLGEERSFRQDFAFGLRQLSDIALKGLSPGVNDPTTAMQAMDRVEAIFVVLGEKSLPARVTVRRVGGREVFAKVGHYGFEDVVGLAFDQVRRAAFTSGQVAVLERLLEILGRAIEANHLSRRRRSLWARAFTIARLAPEHVADPEDAANLAIRAVGVAARLSETDLVTEVGADLEELVASTADLPGGQRVREAANAAG